MVFVAASASCPPRQGQPAAVECNSQALAAELDTLPIVLDVAERKNTACRTCRPLGSRACADPSPSILPAQTNVTARKVQRRGARRRVMSTQAASPASATTSMFRDQVQGFGSAQQAAGKIRRRGRSRCGRNVLFGSRLWETAIWVRAGPKTLGNVRAVFDLTMIVWCLVRLWPWQRTKYRYLVVRPSVGGCGQWAARLEVRAACNWLTSGERQWHRRLEHWTARTLERRVELCVASRRRTE